MAQYASLLSINHSQIYLWSMFEDTFPHGYLELELNAMSDFLFFFFIVQSSVKRSYSDMHSLRLVHLPKTYQQDISIEQVTKLYFLWLLRN